MIIFLFLDKCLKGFNSDAVQFSDGLRSPEKLSFEDRAVSSNLAFIKNKSLLHKFSCITSRNTCSFFHKQHGSGLSPKSCLCFQGFQDSKLFNGCLMA